MKYGEYKEEVKAFRRKIWKMFREQFGENPCCVDCGKELKEDGEGVLMVDWAGFLAFCNEHTWHRIKIKETWEKVFHE